MGAIGALHSLAEHLSLSPSLPPRYLHRVVTHRSLERVPPEAPRNDPEVERDSRRSRFVWHGVVPAAHSVELEKLAGRESCGMEVAFVGLGLEVESVGGVDGGEGDPEVYLRGGEEGGRNDLVP